MQEIVVRREEPSVSFEQPELPSFIFPRLENLKSRLHHAIAPLRSRELLVRCNLAAARINLPIRQGNKPIAVVKYVTIIPRECAYY